ncbi:MAG: hypothetical protein ACYCXT_13345 [Acidiferrobacteraceae bacterium]
MENTAFNMSTTHQHRTALSFTVLSSFENWKAFIRGMKSAYAYEVPLYSDAVLGLFDALRVGPYQFLRSAPSNACEGPFKTIILLRVDVHITKDDFEMLADWDKMNDDAYHGGDLNDEIAALLSLLLGVRLMPGSITREFSDRSDPRGIPGNSSVIPTLSISGPQTLIPWPQHSEMFLKIPELFETYPELNHRDAMALVKAARQYQQALWYSDTDPSQSWLMMVSAIETAANHWRQDTLTPVKMLEEGNKPLYDLLMKSCGGAGLTEQVAGKVAHLMGATRKFRDFVLHFLPGPPERRPSPKGRFPFEDENQLKDALTKIYNYRSQALHAGKPFPVPMCQSPGRYGGDDEMAEIPTGQATGALGSAWQHTDTPMVLHTFEHMVRSALMAWWRSMAPRNNVPQ